MLFTRITGETNGAARQRAAWPLLLEFALLGAAVGCGEKGPPQPKNFTGEELKSSGGEKGLPSSKNFTVVELKSTDGTLMSLLKAEIKKARESGRRPFVEFYADWCGPCRALKNSLNDSRMIEAFEGTYIIQLDLDTWKSKLAGTGFSVRAIPVFFEIDEEGKPTGRSINGDAWGANTPPNMAPPLKKFFKG